MRHFLALTLAAGVLASAIPAQSCNNGSTLLKHDVLPPNGGTFKVAIVPGICVGEAVMKVFDAGGPVDVEMVAVGFAHKLATNGIQAAVDVEIYDGATVSAAGKYTLGTLLFKLSNNSTNLQIQTTGLNTYKLPKPVFVPSGKPVIGFRMIANLANGSCSTGYDANFVTDNQFTCTAGRNVLDALKHGPVDPCTYAGFGARLYPLYYRGDWIIRACVRPRLAVTWTGNPTPGGFVSFKFVAPGQAGDNYFALMSGSTKTGLPTPWGKLPLDLDPLMVCFLSDCRGIWLGSTGAFNPNGESFGSLAIPNLAFLRNSNLTLYAAFFTFKAPAFTPWKSISPASRPIIIR